MKILKRVRKDHTNPKIGCVFVTTEKKEITYVTYILIRQEPLMYEAASATF